MTESRVTVVGAGVVGLCTALRLLTLGMRVRLIDDRTETPNASAVAAGMVAPASESAFDEPAQGRFPLLQAARDLWAETPAADHLHRCGSMVVGFAEEERALAAAADAFRREGATFEPLTPTQARNLVPQLSTVVTRALLTREDARLDAGAALRVLHDAFVAAGGEHRRERVQAEALLRADGPVVISAGWGSHALQAAAPELGALQPVKGQLIRFPGAPPFDGPILRHGSVYLAPSAAGVIAGASMEGGASDLQPSPAVEAALAAAARAVLPHLVEREPVSAVGVRAATPDGLPLVGRSRTGVHLATGFRRNGWLLAPLAARIASDQLTGRDPGPWAELMRPDRLA